MSYPFNVRVYGLLVNGGEVLVSDEIVQGQRITKFPGGGLEFGEGPLDCLVREVREELDVEALDVRHFYTTEHFQPSLFHSGEVQVLALYYTFTVADVAALPVVSGPFAFTSVEEGPCSFRWLPFRQAPEDAVSLPIDRLVLERLKAL